jgi:hypothetical protein
MRGRVKVIRIRTCSRIAETEGKVFTMDYKTMSNEELHHFLRKTFPEGCFESVENCDRKIMIALLDVIEALP